MSPLLGALWQNMHWQDTEVSSGDATCGQKDQQEITVVEIVMKVISGDLDSSTMELCLSPRPPCFKALLALSDT